MQEQPSQLPPNYQPQYNQQYPPQQPYYPPPQKKSRRGLWITLGIIAAVVLFSCIGISVAATNSTKNAVSTLSTAVATVTTDTNTTTQVTSAPAQSFKSFTISGNGPKKTAVFTAPATWSIAYTCYGFTDSGVDGALTVSVYSADGSILDAGAINATCKAGSKPTSDSTIEHQGGSVYLDVNATGKWTIAVKAA